MTGLLACFQQLSQFVRGLYALGSLFRLSITYRVCDQTSSGYALIH